MAHTKETKPTLLNWLWARDYGEFMDYQAKRGKSSYKTWTKAGKPAQDVALTPYAADILARTGGVPPDLRVAPEEPPTVEERVDM